MTEHHEADPPRLPGPLILLWPVAWLIGRIMYPPECLICLGRDQDDDPDL